MLDVPIVVIVSGEGGSGGALGIAIGDRVLMQEFAVYSVIPPEGCAAILWRDAGRKVEAAEALKITAPDLLAMGVIDEIVPSRSAARTPITRRPPRCSTQPLQRALAGARGAAARALLDAPLRQVPRDGRTSALIGAVPAIGVGTGGRGERDRACMPGAGSGSHLARATMRRCPRSLAGRV